MKLPVPANDNDDPHVCNMCGGYALWETCFVCYDMAMEGDL